VTAKVLNFRRKSFSSGKDRVSQSSIITNICVSLGGGIQCDVKHVFIDLIVDEISPAILRGLMQIKIF